MNEVLIFQSFNYFFSLSVSINHITTDKIKHSYLYILLIPFKGIRLFFWLKTWLVDPKHLHRLS